MNFLTLPTLFLLASTAFSFETGIYEGANGTSHCLINLAEDSSSITINSINCEDTSTGLTLNTEEAQKYPFGAYHETFEEDGKQYLLSGVSAPNILNYNINEFGKTFAILSEGIEMLDNKRIVFHFAMSDGDSPLTNLLNLTLSKK